MLARLDPGIGGDWPPLEYSTELPASGHCVTTEVPTVSHLGCAGSIIIHPSTCNLPPSALVSCHAMNIGSNYSPSAFAAQRHDPVRVGILKDQAGFASMRDTTRLEDLLISVPGTSEHLLPAELSPFTEAVELAASAFAALTPHSSDYYCYLSSSTLDVPPWTSQRFRCVHADGVLGSKHQLADGTFDCISSTFFTVSSTLPTEYYIESVNVSDVDPTNEDYCKAFEERVSVQPELCQAPFQMVLMDGYTLHRSPDNPTDQATSRVFLRVEYTTRLYDDSANTLNEAFLYVYPPLVRYEPRFRAFMGGYCYRESSHLKDTRERQATRERRRSSVDLSPQLTSNRGSLLTSMLETKIRKEEQRKKACSWPMGKLIVLRDDEARACATVADLLRSQKRSQLLGTVQGCDSVILNRPEGYIYLAHAPESAPFDRAQNAKYGNVAAPYVWIYDLCGVPMSISDCIYGTLPASAVFVVEFSVTRLQGDEKGDALQSLATMLTQHGARARRAPVFLVGTDGIADEEISDMIEEHLELHASFFDISCVQRKSDSLLCFTVPDCMGEFREAIRKSLLGLSSVGDEVDPKWLKVYKRLLEHPEGVLTVTEFDKLINSEGIKDKQKLLYFLQNKDAIRTFPLVPGLHDLIFVRLDEIIHAFKIIYDAHANAPCLLLKGVAKLWLGRKSSLTRSANRRSGLLQLMQMAQIAIPKPTERALYIPSCSNYTVTPCEPEGGSPSFHITLVSTQTQSPLLVTRRNDERFAMPSWFAHIIFAAAVAWTEQTALNFPWRVSTTAAYVAFGKHEVLLTHDEADGLLTAQLLKTSADAALVSVRLRLIIHDVLLARFPELRCRVLLPLPHLTETDSSIDQDGLMALSHGQVLHMNEGQVLTKEELVSSLSVFLPAEESPARYDIFLSYRWSGYDSPFSDKLFDIMEGSEVSGDKLVVFQDTKRLRTGDQFDFAFMKAMSLSRVVVPLVSWAAVKRMMFLKEDSPCDNVLLEWSLALLLVERTGLKVHPIIIGLRMQNTDGVTVHENLFTATPPRVTRSGDIDWDADFNEILDPRLILERPADVHVASVHLKLERMWQHLFPNEALPEIAQTFTARSVTQQICKFLGSLTWELTKAEKGPLLNQDCGLHVAVAQSLKATIANATWHSPPSPAKLMVTQQETPPQRTPDGVTELLAVALKENTKLTDAALKENAKLSDALVDDVRTGVVAMRHEVAHIGAKVDEALSILRAQFKMLSTLLKGVESIAPKLICFLPAEALTKPKSAKTWLRKISSPKEWFNQRVRVFFFDPVHMSLAPTNGGRGFEITFPKEWVEKAMPYVKLGLSILKVAAAAGKLSGIPIPDVGKVVGDWIGSQLGALDELKTAAIDQMSALTSDPALAAELMGQVDDRCTAILRGTLDEAAPVAGRLLGEQLAAPLERSVRELDTLLGAGWRDKCGLVGPVTARDGTTEFVLEADEAEFRERGAALLQSATVAGGPSSSSAEAASRAQGSSAGDVAGSGVLGRSINAPPGVRFAPAASSPAPMGEAPAGVAPAGAALSRQKSAGSLRRLLGSQIGSSKSESGKSWGDKLGRMKSSKVRDLFGKVSWYTSSDGGGEAAGGGEEEEPIAGLRAVLKAAKLGGKEAMAVAWFYDQEIESIAELKEAGTEAELAKSMGLKKSKVNILLGQIKEYARPDERL